MSVHKFVRFAAPYRSKTFNDKDALVVGRNGVLSGGEVTQSGSVVTIQPVTIIQDGMIVDISVPISATVPLNLAPPYYIIISISSGIENVSETITPSFVKRPQDIHDGMVLVAYYDGTEWVTMPRLQLSEQVASSEERAVLTGATGIASGFEVTQDSNYVYVSPGTLIDVNGRMVTKKLSTTLEKHPASAYPGVTRVDNIVYRRPQDNSNRIGRIEYIVGPTFYEDAPFAPIEDIDAPLISGSVEGTQLLRNDVLGEMASFNIDSGVLKLTIYDSSFVVVSDTTVQSGVSEFNACVNDDGTYDVVFTNATGLTVNFLQVNSTGTVLLGPTNLITGAYVHSEPKIITISSGGIEFKHIVVLKQLNPTENTIRYMRLTNTGTVENADSLLVDQNTKILYLNIEKNEDDTLLYLVFTDSSSGKSYLHTYDLSGLTSATVPQLLETPVELQNEVLIQATSLLAPTTGSAYPMVFLSDTKELFVAWRHFLGSGTYGLALYNKSFKEKYGYKAIIVTSGNLTTYSATYDKLNHFYYVDNDTTGVNVWSVDLNTMTQTLSYTYQPAGGTLAYTNHAVLFCVNGELLVQATEAVSGNIHALASVASVEVTQRENTGATSDTDLANLSRPDESLHVSGLIVEETLAVRRIYEFMSMCVATGTVSWQKTGSNQLTILSPMYLRFINRDCVLTLNTGTYTVPANHAVVVEIPDVDEDATITPEIVLFGEGMLDRGGRRKVVIFWNIGSTLYSRFAPFRLTSDGETIILGDSLSQEMLDWLGSSDSTPDPDNHGYSSVTYIQQSDSHNLALGKLDQALTDYANNGYADLLPLLSGASSLAVTFSTPRPAATYRVAATLENITDDYPMIMPCVITQKTVSGFTLTWTGPLDSSNYKLNYILRNAT